MGESKQPPHPHPLTSLREGQGVVTNHSVAQLYGNPAKFPTFTHTIFERPLFPFPLHNKSASKNVEGLLIEK